MSAARSSSGSGLRRGLRLEPQASGELVQLALGVGGRVAHLLRGHLGAGHGLARLLEPAWISASSWAHALSAAAVSLAYRGTPCELAVEHVAARGNRVAGGVERRGGTGGVGRQGEVALGALTESASGCARALVALALDALGEPLLRTQVAEQLGAADRLGSVLGAPRGGARSATRRG